MVGNLNTSQPQICLHLPQQNSAPLRHSSLPIPPTVPGTTYLLIELFVGRKTTVHVQDHRLGASGMCQRGQA